MTNQIWLLFPSLPELRSSFWLNATMSSRWGFTEAALQIMCLMSLYQMWTDLDYIDYRYWADYNTEVWWVGSRFQLECVGEMQCGSGREKWGVWTGSVKDKQQSPEHIGNLQPALVLMVRQESQFIWFTCTSIVFEEKQLITIWWWMIQPVIKGVSADFHTYKLITYI